jgi:histone H3/H4
MGRKPNGKNLANSSRDGLVVSSKVKTLIREHGLKCSGELVDAISGSVVIILTKACERARANKRATVRPEDI